MLVLATPCSLLMYNEPPISKRRSHTVATLMKVHMCYCRTGGKWGSSNPKYQLQDVAWGDTVCAAGSGCVRGSDAYW